MPCRGASTKVAKENPLKSRLSLYTDGTLLQPVDALGDATKDVKARETNI